ncbi:DUF3040 domain-containing protein [Catellatospora sp. NPDC049133]|uniref:DUF3040 domain-containing protein n=1 Tax=Catellatospora sp. NPDC049133 TaxID=3155499 RepID=UPI0033C3DA9D
MALTPNERRRLREMEQQLARDDPDFATSMSDHGPPPDEPGARRPLLWWSLAVLAGLAVALVVAVVAGIAYAGVLMLFMLAASAFVQLGLRGRVPPGPGG